MLAGSRVKTERRGVRRVLPAAPPAALETVGLTRFVPVGVTVIAIVALLLSLDSSHFTLPARICFLVACLAAVAWLRFERRSMEREMRRARVRALDAIDVERQRIQRDLHDSAQQRLVSVRIHLSLLAQRAEDPDESASIEALGHDLDEALADIRSVTRDGSPELLLRNGVAECLRAVADRTPRGISVESRNFGRYPPSIERGVYFCCLEALQNAVKHAGPSATVRIRLLGKKDSVSFTVEDSGKGFDPGDVEPGAGLINLADRVDVMGGTLSIDSRPGLGTRIRGNVPVVAEAA